MSPVPSPPAAEGHADHRHPSVAPGSVEEGSESCDNCPQKQEPQHEKSQHLLEQPWFSLSQTLTPTCSVPILSLGTHLRKESVVLLLISTVPTRTRNQGQAGQEDESRHLIMRQVQGPAKRVDSLNGGTGGSRLPTDTVVWLKRWEYSGSTSPILRRSSSWDRPFRPRPNVKDSRYDFIRKPTWVALDLRVSCSAAISSHSGYQSVMGFYTSTR